MATLMQHFSFTDGSFSGIRWSRVERSANDPHAVRPTLADTARPQMRLLPQGRVSHGA